MHLRVQSQGMRTSWVGCRFGCRFGGRGLGRVGSRGSGGRIGRPRGHLAGRAHLVGQQGLHDGFDGTIASDGVPVIAVPAHHNGGFATAGREELHPVPAHLGRRWLEGSAAVGGFAGGGVAESEWCWRECVAGMGWRGQSRDRARLRTWVRGLESHRAWRSGS